MCSIVKELTQNPQNHENHVYGIWEAGGNLNAGVLMLIRADLLSDKRIKDIIDAMYKDLNNDPIKLTKVLNYLCGTIIYKKEQFESFKKAWESDRVLINPCTFDNRKSKITPESFIEALKNHIEYLSSVMGTDFKNTKIVLK